MRPEVELWWLQAQEDLSTAEHNVTGGRHYAGVFFAQQAVEKALKALHIHLLGRTPGPTHSLVALGRAVSAPGPLQEFLEELTPTYVTTRYPDVTQEVPARLWGKERASRYVAGAKEVMEWVGKRLG